MSVTDPLPRTEYRSPKWCPHEHLTQPPHFRGSNIVRCTACKSWFRRHMINAADQELYANFDELERRSTS